MYLFTYITHYRYPFQTTQYVRGELLHPSNNKKSRMTSSAVLNQRRGMHLMPHPKTKGPMCAAKI